MSNITRRATLAASVTLPLLPVTAYATPADPAVEAFRRWSIAQSAYVRSFDRPHVPDDDPVMIAVGEAAFSADIALCDTVATTPAGLAGKLRLAFDLFGLVKHGGDWKNPNDYEVDGFVHDQGKRLLRNMLKGAENMA